MALLDHEYGAKVYLVTFIIGIIHTGDLILILDGPEHHQVTWYDENQFTGIIATEGKLLNHSNTRYKISNQRTRGEVSATIIPPSLNRELGIVGSYQNMKRNPDKELDIFPMKFLLSYPQLDY